MSSLGSTLNKKRKDSSSSSSALLTDGARPTHLIGVPFLVLLILLPKLQQKYFD